MPVEDTNESQTVIFASVTSMLVGGPSEKLPMTTVPTGVAVAVELTVDRAIVMVAERISTVPGYPKKLTLSTTKSPIATMLDIRITATCISDESFEP